MSVTVHYACLYLGTLHCCLRTRTMTLSIYDVNIKNRCNSFQLKPIIRSVVFCFVRVGNRTRSQSLQAVSTPQVDSYRRYLRFHNLSYSEKTQAGMWFSPTWFFQNWLCKKNMYVTQEAHTMKRDELSNRKGHTHLGKGNVTWKKTCSMKETL